MIVWGNLSIFWSVRGFGPAVRQLHVACTEIDAALLQPTKLSPWKTDVWNTWYVMAFPLCTL